MGWRTLTLELKVTYKPPAASYGFLNVRWRPQQKIVRWRTLTLKLKVTYKPPAALRLFYKCEVAAAAENCKVADANAKAESYIQTPCVFCPLRLF